MCDSTCPCCLKIGPGSYPYKLDPADKTKLSFNLEEELRRREQVKLEKLMKMLPKGYKIVKEK